ncbi:EamA family transporter [Streptomyces sp. NPDC048297]|uniref:EamA family transporter n=1 Tax=Streptomyces sp. NPDC048297 TaxID=3365531 RepID=UPI00372479DC
MTPLVTAAVLLAAVTHASWNAIAHQITDKLTGFTLISGGGLLIGAALIPFTAVPAGAAWPYLLASSAVHIAYYALLMTSFRLGDFGQAYPIARGSAPLVVTVLAAVFADEVPGAWATAGIAVSCVGLTGVSLWGLRGHRPNWAAIGAALATGLTIAAYTVIDGLGVRAAHTPLGYTAWLMVVQGAVIPAYMYVRERGDTLRLLRPHAGLGLLGAALCPPQRTPRSTASGTWTSARRRRHSSRPRTRPARDPCGPSRTGALRTAASRSHARRPRTPSTADT